METTFCRQNSTNFADIDYYLFQCNTTKLLSPYHNYNVVLELNNKYIKSDAKIFQVYFSLCFPTYRTYRNIPRYPSARQIVGRNACPGLSAGENHNSVPVKKKITKNACPVVRRLLDGGTSQLVAYNHDALPCRS